MDPSIATEAGRQLLGVYVLGPLFVLALAAVAWLSKKLLDEKDRAREDTAKLTALMSDIKMASAALAMAIEQDKPVKEALVRALDVQTLHLQNLQRDTQNLQRDTQNFQRGTEAQLAETRETLRDQVAEFQSVRREAERHWTETREALRQVRQAP